MLLGGLVAGGALVASVKVYKESKRKKETPWTVYPERLALTKEGMAKNKRFPNGKSSPFFVRQKRFRIEQVRHKTVVQVSTVYDKAKAEIQAFRHEKIRPQLGDLREQQLQEISSAQDAGQKSEFEKVLDRHYNLALVSCCLTGAGVFYTPLLFVGVPLLVYLKSFSWKSFFVEQHQYGPLILDAIGDIAPIMDGRKGTASSGSRAG